MFNIAICGDDHAMTTHVDDCLDTYKQRGVVKVTIFDDSEIFGQALSDGDYFDLVFLEVELHGMDGIAIGQKIRKSLHNEITQIICVSADSNRMKDAFSIRPLNYILKPVSVKEVMDNVDMAMNLAHVFDECFECVCGTVNYRMPYDSIVYFESHNRKININTVCGKRSVYEKLDTIEGCVPPNFFRIHKSYLVNRKYVTSWRTNEVVLQGEVTLPISRKYRKIVGELFLNIESDFV